MRATPLKIAALLTAVLNTIALLYRTGSLAGSLSFQTALNGVSRPDSSCRCCRTYKRRYFLSGCRHWNMRQKLSHSGPVEVHLHSAISRTTGFGDCLLSRGVYAQDSNYESNIEDARV